MSEAWEKVKLLPIPYSVVIFPADSWWYVMRALKKITFKMAPTGNEVEWTELKNDCACHQFARGNHSNI